MTAGGVRALWEAIQLGRRWLMANNDDHCVANAPWIMDTATEGRSVRSLSRSLGR